MMSRDRACMGLPPGGCASMRWTWTREGGHASRNRGISRGGGGCATRSDRGHATRSDGGCATRSGGGCATRKGGGCMTRSDRRRTSASIGWTGTFRGGHVSRNRGISRDGGGGAVSARGRRQGSACCLYLRPIPAHCAVGRYLHGAATSVGYVLRRID